MSESRACLEQITNSEQAKQFRGQKESLIVGKSLSTDTNTNTKTKTNTNINTNTNANYKQ